MLILPKVGLKVNKEGRINHQKVCPARGIPAVCNGEEFLFEVITNGNERKPCWLQRRAKYLLSS